MSKMRKRLFVVIHIHVLVNNLKSLVFNELKHENMKIIKFPLGGYRYI